jgi:hypothetical protein
MQQGQIEQSVSFFMKRDVLIKLIEEQKGIDTDLLHVSAVFRTTGEVSLVISAVKANSDLSKGFPAFFRIGTS